MRNKYKILLYVMILISIFLCLPYIVHLIQNETVEGFSSFYAYTYDMEHNVSAGKLNWIIFTSLILIFSVLYIFIIKYENKIFDNKKEIYIFILIISILFSFILYYIMYDIFYYMGDTWLSAKYGENPYYTTVLDLQNNGIDDEILRNTGPWKATISVYGPIWNMISTFLIYFSFGNLTVGLFIFKAASLLMHMLNCYIIYRITKSRKYLLLYGLNPLILIEALSNLHNDLYLITFILLALFFLIKKKNILLTLLFLAVSVATKYSTALIVPFILIYIYRDKTICKRILYSFVSGIGIIAFVVLSYMPYFRDVSIFTNMLVQGERYSQSIWAILLNKIDFNILTYIKTTFTGIFILIYIIFTIDLLFKKNLKMNDIAIKYNITTLIFIFCILTNFHEWYLMWIIPALMWQKKYMRYFIIFMTIISLIYPIGFYIVGTDSYIYGLTYSIKILIGSSILTVSTYIINKIKQRKNNICIKEG